MKSLMLNLMTVALIAVTASSGSALADKNKNKSKAENENNKPVTSQCLGDIDTYLSCPAGTKRSNLPGSSACYTTSPDPDRKAPVRSGPSVWYREAPSRSNPRGTINRAGPYLDHEKTGRHYRFDKTERLSGFSDYRADDYDGLSVKCHANGNVESIQQWSSGKLHGLVRNWAADGSLKYATTYVNGKRIGRVDPTTVSHDSGDLCRPTTCR